MHKGALSDGPDLAACEPAGQPARGGWAERLGQLAALGAELAVQAGTWECGTCIGVGSFVAAWREIGSPGELSGAAGRPAESEPGRALSPPAEATVGCRAVALPGRRCGLLRRPAPDTTRAGRPRRREEADPREVSELHLPKTRATFD